MSDLGVGVAVAGLGLDLDLARGKLLLTARCGSSGSAPHQGAGLQQLAPPRLKGRQAVVPLLPQPFRLRHLADVEVREIDLVQQVIEQRLIAAIVEFCLQAGKVCEVLLARGRHGRNEEAPRRVADRQEVIGVAGDRQVQIAVGRVDAAALRFDCQRLVR